ncbi:DNA repair protein rad52 [Entomophthora muscae]|uniref:DNA repair protein rad52 n=1 Tax=Entomophthora muscae TaxID=34485 RepID=A0ACC2SMY7_9FUNG|nr:DNA repair protein rad52 [Entomophthora muscae]
MSYQRSTSIDATQEDVKPKFKEGQFVYPDEDQEKIQERLNIYLTKDDISSRAAFNGSKVSYIEGWKTFQIANEIFGFNGWSTSILNTSVDYLDVIDGRFSVGISSLVRVTLKDGSYHEDIGYGMMENSKSKGAAFEKAKKESVTDAVKRALRYFGNSLGNCLYDKGFLKASSKATTGV